jgi:hypothetical protein
MDYSLLLGVHDRRRGNDAVVALLGAAAAAASPEKAAPEEGRWRGADLGASSGDEADAGFGGGGGGSNGTAPEAPEADAAAVAAAAAAALGRAAAVNFTEHTPDEDGGRAVERGAARPRAGACSWGGTDARPMPSPVNQSPGSAAHPPAPLPAPRVAA